MAGLEEMTGVHGHDGDKAEHSLRDLMSGILAAIALIQGRRVVVHDSPSSAGENKDDLSPLVPGLALEGVPERLGFLAGPIHSDPGKVPKGLGPHPPTDLVATPGRSPRVQGIVQIQVGDSVLLTTEGTFPVDIMRHDQANPGFGDGFRMAWTDRELPADAPAVSIFRDGNLEFYRDSEQTYMSPTLREILTDTQVASPQQSQDRAEERVITIVPLSQAEAVAGQNSGDSSLSDPTLVAEQATTPKVIKDAVTGEIKGLDGPGESALDVPAKIADRQADETRISTGSSSTGGSSAGSDPPSDELGGHSLAVSSFLSWVMNSCYDPSGGPAQVIGDDYIVNRGQGGSITLTAKDERGVIFAVNGGGEIGQNDLKPQDFERLRFIESTASQRLQRPTINPPRIGRSREIELE